MKNLAMWAVIVFLTIGLYNMFKNPQANVGKGNSIIFSEFLSEVDNGGVIKVDIQGNNIREPRIGSHAHVKFFFLVDFFVF